MKTIYEAAVDAAVVDHMREYRRHGVLLLGPRNSGKVRAARAAPDLMGEMSSLTKLLTREVCRHAHVDAPNERPFRAPHSSTSMAGMVGLRGRPGEVSLAHGGVLLLDDLPAFSAGGVAALVDALREQIVRFPLGDVVFPARALVIATATPCPCGYRGARWQQAADRCRCAGEDIEAHMSLTLSFAESLNLAVVGAY